MAAKNGWMVKRWVGVVLVALAALVVGMGGCAEDTARSASGDDTSGATSGADTSAGDTGTSGASGSDTSGASSGTDAEADTENSDTSSTSGGTDATDSDTSGTSSGADATDSDTSGTSDTSVGEDAADASDPDAPDMTVPPLPEPQDPGPDTSATQGDVTLDDRGFLPDLKGTVCVPTDGFGAPHPLVVISPGFAMNRDQYKSYCEHLASWGFVAVVQTYQGITHNDYADSVGDIIDWALDPSSGLDIDADKIATAGHSLGGKVSILAAIRDARVKAVVAWDPVDTNLPSVTPEQMGDFGVPLAMLGETLDATAAFPPAPACAPADNNYDAYFTAASSRPILAYTVLEADHMDWVDDPTCLLCGACRPGEANHLEVKALTRRTTVAFLRRHLLSDTEMDTYLTGPAALADEAAGVWTIQSR